MSAVIALRFTIFQVSLCFFDPTKRPSLPRFLLDLFRGTSNQSTTQEPRRYPDPRLLAPWTESDNLHATAVFFLRIHPQATFYDLMQVLIMSLHTDCEYISPISYPVLLAFHLVWSILCFDSL